MRPPIRTLLLAGFVSLLGCGDDAAPEAAEAAPPDASYTVRGRIADITGSEVSIQHEAIEGFRNREGEVVGMATMTMAFHRPDSVSLEGIAVDDRVRFTFDVRWGGDHPMTLRTVEKLPPDTALSF